MSLRKITLPNIGGGRTASVRTDLARLVADSLKKNCDRTAIFSLGKTSSFEEVENEARRFMNQLDEAKVPYRSAVALQMERGLPFLACALGCVMRGNPFMPISATDAAPRTERILARALPGAIAEVQSGGVFVTKPKKPPRLFPPTVTYILHTSGSTGVPKGIMIEERNLTSFCGWYAQALGFQTTSRITFSSKPTFDFSIPEFFLPVLTGGAMICPSRTISESVHKFVREIGNLGATHLHIVPTLLNFVLQATKQRRHDESYFASLEVVCCNGEPLSGTTANEVFSQFPNVRLINSYGPTETCVGVTANIMTDNTSGDKVSIGIPGDGTTLLLDVESETSGDIFGELVIAGEQVGAGYINPDPQKDEVFFETLVNGVKQRAYRTGDIFQLSAENELFFVERKDFQVKYRGVRLELGEVESACRSYPSCEDAVGLIIDDEDSATSQKLIVFVSPKQAASSELMDHLKEVLPKTAIPDHLVALESIPSTRNGKKDRGLLAGLAKEKFRAKSDIVTGDKGIELKLSASDALKRCLESVLERDVDLDSEIDLRELDSLGLLRLEFWLAEFGYELNLEADSSVTISLQGLSERLLPADRPLAGSSKRFAKVSTNVALDEVRAVFEAVENCDQDVVLLQSSLLGLQAENPSAVLDHILLEIERLASKKTLVVPAYTLGTIESGRYHFQESAPETGIIAGHLREKINIVRTRHPVYSFLVCGEKSHEVENSDYWQKSPFGEGSFFEWLSEQNATALLVGTRALATTHRYEHLARVPYHRFLTQSFKTDFGSGSFQSRSLIYSRDLNSEVEASLFGVDLDSLFAILEPNTEEFNIGRSGVSVINLRVAEQAVVNALSEEPLKLIKLEKLAAAREYLRSKC